MPIDRDQAASVLEALVSLVRVTRTYAHRDSAHSMTATPIALLRLVSKTDPRLGDLAEQLRVKPSVASRAVAALEAEGYVSRIPDPDDARACRIRITEAGRTFLKSREDWSLDIVARTLADWSPEDAEQSIQVLQRLEHCVDEWMDEFERAAAAETNSLAAVATKPDPAKAIETPANQSMTTWEKTAI